MRGDACSLLTWLLAFDQKERKKIEAWVALADFQQLDESFVRLLGCTTEGKMGRDGGLDFSMWVRSHPLLFLVFSPKLEEERMGKGGVTYNMLDDIHDHWKRADSVKIKCLGVPTLDVEFASTLRTSLVGRLSTQHINVLILYLGEKRDQEQDSQVQGQK
ncbi:hypothetical protein L3X38_023837 [Prunus dulcis]|uniref:CRM domain-containing protein n=1 Tax=Prunus dulcis TaxID=3755 RepID=A0AAD4VYN4_PRUDU|nr:hypothetical protein L3X38_023837 [Prunus dulcis]